MIKLFARISAYLSGLKEVPNAPFTPEEYAELLTISLRLRELAMKYNPKYFKPIE